MYNLLVSNTNLNKVIYHYTTCYQLYDYQFQT